MRSNVIDEVCKLKEQPSKNILIDGSSVLIHTLAENDLVDEYSLHVYPLVLGSGKRLFPEGKRIDLDLIESRALRPKDHMMSQIRASGYIQKRCDRR